MTRALPYCPAKKSHNRVYQSSVFPSKPEAAV